MLAFSLHTDGLGCAMARREHDKCNRRKEKKEKEDMGVLYTA